MPDDLLLQEMEVMVFFEGIDAMTSNSVQVGLPDACTGVAALQSIVA